MMRDDGRVSEQARSALLQLLAIEPGHVQARFWLAFGKEQDGKYADAAADYEKLMIGLPNGAQWRSLLEERLTEVRTALAAGPNAGTSSVPSSEPVQSQQPSSPGPTAADIRASDNMTSQDRQAMIVGMVSGLAARLERDGRDLEGWQRLIRSLTVLGRNDEALAALGRARTSLADEPNSLATLADLAKSLGLGT